MLQAEGLAESDLIPGKYEGTNLLIIPTSQTADGALGKIVTQMIFNEGWIARVDPGGFKLWECAVDLARFMCQHFHLQDFDQHAYPQLPGCPRVLELGCGQGIPGILLLKAGADVHFQVSNIAALPPATWQ
jgi:hypothetical protein